MKQFYIVGLPIGNLKDITLRALEVLKEVDVIACEDTRVTQKLLNHYKISGKRLISHHDKNEKRSTKGILMLIEQNLKIALVSDAGMPGIADPGFYLIRELRKNQIEIEIIPGVSACTTAFVLANMSTTYTFLGFLSPKSGTRKTLLKKLQIGTYVVYVSPHSLQKFLEELNLVFQDKINLYVGRELTKLYETSYYGNSLEILEELISSQKLRGEFTIVFQIKKIST